MTRRQIIDRAELSPRPRGLHASSLTPFDRILGLYGNSRNDLGRARPKTTTVHEGCCLQRRKSLFQCQRGLCVNLFTYPSPVPCSLTDTSLFWELPQRPLCPSQCYILRLHLRRRRWESILLPRYGCEALFLTATQEVCSTSVILHGHDSAQFRPHSVLAKPPAATGTTTRQDRSLC